MSNLMSADEAAVRAAEAMFGKSDSGGMPSSQSDAEGGLSAKAPGKPMVGKAKMKSEDADEGEEEKKAWRTKKSADADEEKEEKARKAEDEGEEEDEEKKDEEEEDEEKEEGEEKARKGRETGISLSDDKDADDLKKKKACKSNIDEDDLIKALDILDATAAGVSAQPDRRAELAAKLADGTIEKSEQAELASLLGSEEDDTDAEVAKSFSEVFAGDEQLRQDYEISPFIERHSQLVAEGLDFLRSSIEKSEARQGSFNVALAKSFRSIGRTILDQAEMIKSQQGQIQMLTERLGIVERTPVGRKSLSGTAALSKSFGGEPENVLSRGQIMDGLERLMAKGRSNGFLAPCGEPIERAVADYETTGKITKSLLADVRAELGLK